MIHNDGRGRERMLFIPLRTSRHLFATLYIWNDYLILFEYVPLAIFCHQYFLRISEVWRMLRHGSVGRVRKKTVLLFVYLNFLAFLLFFISFVLQKLCFYHFHFFFDKTSNFCNRIFTNQRPELSLGISIWLIFNGMLISVYLRI